MMRKIVLRGAKIEPPPADDLEIGKTGLPELARRGGFIDRGRRKYRDGQLSQRDDRR